MKSVFVLGLGLFSVFNVSVLSQQTPPQHEVLGQMLYFKLSTIILNNNVDLILMMDNSASVTQSGYKKAKRASQDVAKIADSFAPISATGSRVGVIAFSDPLVTGVRFSLGAYNTLRAVKRKIRRQAFDAGATRATEVALQHASVEYQSSPAGQKKLLWVYTDGLSNGDPIPDATTLKTSGVAICVMVINPNNDPALMTQVNAIASPGCVCEFPSFKMYRRAMKFAASQIPMAAAG